MAAPAELPIETLIAIDAAAATALACETDAALLTTNAFDQLTEHIAHLAGINHHRSVVDLVALSDANVSHLKSWREGRLGRQYEAIPMIRVRLRLIRRRVQRLLLEMD